MHSSVKHVAWMLVSLILTAGVAQAGALVGDANALLSGTQPFQGGQIGDIGVLKANVDYAVYAPGLFGTSLALGLPAGFDPSGGTEYVYAYEIFNLANSSVLSSFSVGLNHGAISNQANQGVLPDAGTPFFKQEWIPLLAATSLKDNIKWTYAGPAFLPLGGHSDILLFTSPFGPTFKNSSLVGIGSLNNRLLPTPIPEPSTVVLFAIACIGLLVTGIHRRKV